MGKLRRNYNRFINKNHDRGISRLMLWICIGNAIVYAMSLFNSALPTYLFYSSSLILRGQVWRLFTYIFTFACQSDFFGIPVLGAVISIMFYYWVGTMLEGIWGTLRFNIFYFSGILLADLYGLLLQLIFGIPVLLSSHYVNLSMFLAVATMIPDQRVYVYMIIPVKMKWLAWLDLGLTFYEVIRGLVAVGKLWGIYPLRIDIGLVFYQLIPLIALLNYFLFFGREIRNLLPDWMRRGVSMRKRQAEFRRQSAPKVVPGTGRAFGSERPYRHKCTVCGRTDADCPDLEFRYCSKCRGYFCYCIDHINNHTHVQ